MKENVDDGAYKMTQNDAVPMLQVNVARPWKVGGRGGNGREGEGVNSPAQAWLNRAGTVLRKTKIHRSARAGKTCPFRLSISFLYYHIAAEVNQRKGNSMRIQTSDG